MIRKHTVDDLEVIIKIWQESSALAHPFLSSTFVDRVESDMRNIYIPGSDTWVYENNGKVVGFISMIENEIGGLFVLPEYHSKGIGTKMVHFVRKFNDQLEVEVFEKNKMGRIFYDKMGFNLAKDFMHEPSGEKVLRLID